MIKCDNGHQVSMTKNDMHALIYSLSQITLPVHLNNYRPVNDRLVVKLSTSKHLRTLGSDQPRYLADLITLH